jgi:hypothetical protein
MTVNANQAAAGHPRSTNLRPPTTGDVPVITDSGCPDDGDDGCTTHHPDCPHIRCTLRDGHPGLCWRVDHNPYRASYWEKPE